MYHREILLLYLATHKIPDEIIVNTVVHHYGTEEQKKLFKNSKLKKRYPKNIVGRLHDK